MSILDGFCRCRFKTLELLQRPRRQDEPPGKVTCMKKYRTSAFFIILALLLLASPQLSHADQQWHYQASAQVSQPGLIETVLPAGVFFGTDGTAKTSQLDLTLVGPDNNPRSFELFWKGETGTRGGLAY
jgi:hypothetical protein